jgi:hypothetical protein
MSGRAETSSKLASRMEVNALPAVASGDGGAVFVVFFLFMIVAVLLTVMKGGRRKDNLKAAAERLHGVIVPSFWSGDRLEFAVDGVPAVLIHGAGGENRPAQTRARFQFTPPGILRIVPEGLFASLRKAFGARDIELGDPGFDGGFLVQGSPEPWVREVLDEPTRRQILRLAQLGASFWNGAHVSIEAGPGGVTIFCQRDLADDGSQLNAFLDGAVAVFRNLRTPVTEGISILPAEEHAVRGDCPVCASPLDAAPRHCPMCRTPHHRDCWEYFGGCAIYACVRRGGRS